MQWVFLVIAVMAALVELHTGTFYLAAVAAAALITTLSGFWINDELLIFVFLLLCASLAAAVMLFRSTWAHGTSLSDFDIGQTVSISSLSPRGHSVPRGQHLPGGQHLSGGQRLPEGQRLIVSYRGANWDAVMADGAVLAPGDTAVIVGKTDKLLHLALPQGVARA